MIKYDVTWYWYGGTEFGQWRAADASLKQELEHQGYVARDGRRSIGPPEGPPSEEEFERLKDM